MTKSKSYLLAGKKLLILIGLTSVLAVVIIVSTFVLFNQINLSVKAENQQTKVLKAADMLMTALIDAQNGQRGYLLTHSEDYLGPYLENHDKIQELLGVLRTFSSSQGPGQLNRISILIQARLQNIQETIELNRSKQQTAAMELFKSGEGKQLMDSIRTEMGSYINAEILVLAKKKAQFEATMSSLFVGLIIADVFIFMVVNFFGFSLFGQFKMNGTSLLLKKSEQLLLNETNQNVALHHINYTLSESEDRLAVTLNSIGDAVIATDNAACVTLFNPVAQKLTGWHGREAIGKPITEVFNIINKETRLPTLIPIMATLANGTVQGLANHTILISRSGEEFDIADSCAPIYDRNRLIIGAILIFRNVTDEYRIQQALQDSKARVEAVFNTVADGIVTIDAETSQIETVNHSLEKMFGYHAADIQGKKFSTLIPEFNDVEKSSNLDYYAATAKDQEKGLGREVAGLRKDSSTFPLEIGISETSLGGKRYFTAILRDLSARKLAEEALLKAYALQNAIFNSANFSSIATDAKGVIQIFNVGAQTMLGYSEAEVVNTITPADISDSAELIERAQELSDELGTSISPGFEALVFKASRGIEDIYALTYIRKDQSRFPALVSVTALRNAQSVIIGYLLIGTDHSARLKIEEERLVLHQALQDKNVELETAKELAERANLAKSDFLSSMSHELRTPLSAILGFAQLMESGSPPPSPAQTRSIEQILKAGWFLLELINEILDLALIESGKLSLSPEPVALAEVIRECQSMIEPNAAKHQISVQFCHFEENVYVEADRIRLKQIIINLLSNAIKYNKEGGTVVLESEVRPLDIMRISIRDSGIGLSKAHLAQLFEPFNRLGQENMNEQGTGIGLVVCKRLVEYMGGTIGVESVLGQGSVFWFELKMSLGSFEKNAEAPQSFHDYPEAPDGRKWTLLYVEDNPANLMLVEDIILRRKDLNLISALDGTQGLALARSVLPDVILMDINLPGMSGTEVMKILSLDPLTAHIPVIALSANAIPKEIEKSLKAGFFRYLTKPIKLNEFMKALNLALQVKKD